MRFGRIITEILLMWKLSRCLRPYPLAASYIAAMFAVGMSAIIH